MKAYEPEKKKRKKKNTDQTEHRKTTHMHKPYITSKKHKTIIILYGMNWEKKLRGRRKERVHRYQEVGAGKAGS